MELHNYASTDKKTFRYAVLVFDRSAPFARIDGSTLTTKQAQAFVCSPGGNMQNQCPALFETEAEAETYARLRASEDRFSYYWLLSFTTKFVQDAMPVSKISVTKC